MAYMNKELKHYVDKMDCEFYIPETFKKFINKHKALENLFLKRGNICRCTHCYNEFITTSKINDVIKCPYCKGKYLIKRFNIKNYFTKKNLILLDKLEDKYVLRVFELFSTYNSIERKFNYKCSEYRRVIFDDKYYNETVESDIVFHTMGLSVTQHWKEHTCWKRKVWNWYYNFYGNTIGYIDSANIKQLLKGTKYQYTQLWKVIPKVKPFNLVALFQKGLNYYSKSFELLAKLKLYNLSLECQKFGKQGNFQDRFGIPKQLLSFLQNHNINYEQLEVLRCVPVADIKMINGLTKVYDLGRFSSLVDIEKAWRKGLFSNYNMYYDYLINCKKLKYDMSSKKVLYPNQNELKELHDKGVKLVELAKNELNNDLIKERAKQLETLTYQDKNFKIYAPTDLSSIIEEANQMGNCIFSNYAEKYALGECNLFFVRDVNNLDKSLISVETDINNTRIVQAEQSHHRNVEEIQQKFLDKWLKHISNKGVIENA